MGKNYFKIDVNFASRKDSISFKIARWENDANIGFIESLKNNGVGATIAIEKIELEDKSQSEPPIIDVFIYENQFWVFTETIQQFCEVLWIAGISRPLLSISELRRTYQ